MNTTLESPAAEAQLKAVRPARKRILLVDDDPAIRQILPRLLMDEGYAVVAAANGAEALECDRTTKFDLVLLDLNMPVKDGWETYDELTSKHPGLPVIVVTARCNQFFPALSAGVGGLLEKPLDFTKLFYTVSHLLRETSEDRAARAAGHKTAFLYFSSIPDKPRK